MMHVLKCEANLASIDKLSITFKQEHFSDIVMNQRRLMYRVLRKKMYLYDNI